MTSNNSTKECEIGNQHRVDWLAALRELSTGVLKRIATREQRRLRLDCGCMATVGRRVRSYARKMIKVRSALGESDDQDRKRFIRWFDRTFTSLVKNEPPGVYFFDGNLPVAWVAFSRSGNVISRELIDPLDGTGPGMNVFITNHMGDVRRFQLRSDFSSDNKNHQFKRGD